ncbi:thiolase family protein [Williamsia sp. DF01-3]|uniref:thiolase family protein n=1 Tax=Williamsia sp. DF01-3 TaxID=2934157 RepID=UPI001FF5124B|nr:thiolase family protein [Williamsia sp. DF01-3]MCK0517340.1 thiolase family protein [Williamsia sp. DF01-3]
MTGFGERDVVISGVGQSQVGRRLNVAPLELTLQAVLAAAAEAGLSRTDIDGICTWPGAMESAPGFSGVGTTELQDALGLELSWYFAGPDGPGQLSQVVTAAAAVSAGLANHVVCFRTVWEASARSRPIGSTTRGTSPRRRAAGWRQWQQPYGAGVPSVWTALYARHYMEEFGLTREQLAQVALTARANAGFNDSAVYTDPLSMSDYLESRTISDPLCLFDCDVPVDGATALIVSHRDTVADLACTPIEIAAVGSAQRDSPLWEQRTDLSTMAAHDAADMMWSRTDLRATDVDVAELYDGFSFLTIMWLEALGFCGRGEAGGFVDGGLRIARDGTLPLNTQGGQLSGGRLHGLGFAVEAVRQLRGVAGRHQLQRRPEVAVASAGGGPLAGCLLLTR